MSEQFKVGVGRRSITPALGSHLYGYRPDVISTSVHDDLTVTAVAMTFGNEKAILISVTVCLISTELADRIRNDISYEAGVPKERIILSATHTHSGPNTKGEIGWGDIDEDYCRDIFIPQIILSAKEAFDNLKTAVMGIGVADSKVGVNRRQQDENHRILLGQCPWGSYDSAMTVIRFRQADGKPIANIIHYGAHGTAAGCNTEISRDWPGIMTDRLEEESGAVTLFLNGASGDVGPRLTNGKTTGNITHVKEIGYIAAADAIRAYKGIKQDLPVSMSGISGELILPYQKRLPLADAENALKLIEKESAGVNINAKRYDYFKRIVESYQAGLKEEEDLRLPQTIIKVGDVVFIGFPYEIFSQISLRLRDYSPFTHTLCLSNTNGSYGYLPSQDQICRGGYEVEMFLKNDIQSLAMDTDNTIITENLKLIKQLKRG